MATDKFKERRAAIIAAALTAITTLHDEVDRYEQTTHGLLVLADPFDTFIRHLREAVQEPTAYNVSNLSQAIDAFRKHLEALVR